MSKITFPAYNGYVSEGTMFTKKEADKVAKVIKNSLELDWANKLISGENKVNYSRPDAIIPKQVPDTSSIESYVLSHGGQHIAGKTIAKV